MSASQAWLIFVLALSLGGGIGYVIWAKMEEPVIGASR